MRSLRLSMRLTLILVSVLLTSFGVRAQAPAAQTAGEPKTTWFFYTVKWGFLGSPGTELEFAL